MIRKEIRFWTVTARLVMMLVLLVGYGTSAWGQNNTATVSSYLTEDKPLQYCIDNNLMQQGPNATVTWNPELKAAFFKGGANGPMSGSHPFLAIIDRPFANVNSASGFTVSMEFKTYAAANKVSFGGVNGIGTYQWSRLIEANIGEVGAIRSGGFQKYFCIITCGPNAARNNPNQNDQWHLCNEFASPCGLTGSTYIDTSDGPTNKCKARNMTPGTKSYWADVHNDESFHAISLVVKPGSGNSDPTVTTYIDGVVWSTTPQIGESGGSLTYAQIIKDVLDNINNFNNILIGRSGFEADGDFCGYIRNIQIVSSGYTSTIRFGTAPSHGTVTAAVSGASSGMNVTTAGVILPKETSITLTGLPDVGYYMSSITYDGTTVNNVTSTQFTTSTDIYEIGATFAEREYTVAYDQNSDVTVGGNTTTETVTGMPTSTSTKYKYFTDAFTFPTNTPTRTGYTFLGWSTNKDATTATYTASECKSGKTLAAAEGGATESDKGVFSSAVSDQNVLKLYAIWQKNDYALNINVITQDYTGSQIDTDNGTNSVTGTGGTLALARALQTTPDTWTATNTVVQYKDRVKITTTNATDYHLQELRYSYNDGTAHTVNITDWDGYSDVVKDFTMDHAAITTVTAVFKHNQQYAITSDIQQNDGAGNSVAYLVTHNSTEGDPIASTASPTAMENDLVKVKTTIASNYILRTVDYQFTGETGWHSLYNNKTAGTGSPATFTTDALTMLGQAVTVKTIFLADRTVSVGGHSERGSIIMTGTYGTSSGDVTTAATSANDPLTANSGDLVTVTAACGTGWHFDGTDAAAIISAKNGETALTTTSVSVSDGTQATATFTMVDADVSVAAAYKENTYTIAYDLKGGSGTFANQTKSHFVSLQLNSATPTLASSTFMGWATSEADAENKVVAYAPGAIAGEELNGTAHGATVTLYAVWKSKEYTVSVDPGINGGTVSVDKTTVTAQSPVVTVQYNAYEGYSTQPTLYYYTASEVKAALAAGTSLNKMGHQIDGTSFSIAGINDDVTVYATFVGNYDATRDKTTTSTSIEHGDISVGGVSIKDDNVAKIGSIVNAVAKPDNGFRLEKIRWMKVTDGQMKVRHRAPSDTDVEVAGWNELKYDGTDPVIYNNANGEYVATINGLKSDIYMTGSFTAKKDIGNTTEVTVVFTGPGAQQYIGGDPVAAVVPPTGSYSVTFDGKPQTEGVDYTIEWSENYNTTDNPKATIKATVTNELYKGTYVADNAFTIVAPPTGDYETSYSSDFTYDGTAKTLSNLTVYLVTNTGQANEDKTLMTYGTGDGQYEVTYVNNTNAGTATAKIEIHGTDGGTLIRTFNIKPKPITVTASDQTVTYGTSIAATGTQATAVTLVGGHSLTSANFAQTHKDVGTHSGDIEVSGAKIKDSSNNDVTSNYSITYVKGNLTITAKELTITPIARTLEYGDALPTGDNALTAHYTVDGLAYGETLTAGPTGYSVKKASDNSAVTLAQGTPAGAYKLTLSEATASANYTIAYAEGDLTITQYDLSKATVTVTGGEQPYDGSAKTATSVVVKKGDWTLPAADYTVKYASEASKTEPGTYTITTVANSDNVTGTATAETPLVIGKYDLTGDLVTATVADQTFTGSQIRPTTFTTLTINGANISTDHYDIISYGTNINVGTGTLTIRAKDTSGMLKGDRTVEFNIVAAALNTQTASVAYADYVMAGSSTDTHQLKLNSGKTEVSTTLINGQVVSLASNSLVVKLKLHDNSTNTTALSPDDYDVYFQKDSEEPIASIPANAIGVYKVVVKGKTNAVTTTTNTTNYYVTDLKVNVKLAVTLANRTWTTYYDERFSLQLPTGFNAYYVPTAGITAATTNTPATVNTTSVGFIPKGVPVLIERTTSAPEGTIFELEEDITNTIPTGTYNNFVGVPSTGEMPDATPTYILMNDAFVGYEPGTVIGAHRAFLTTTPSAARMVISIGDGTTGLEAVDVDTIDSERWYDLQGNRIAKPTRKGLYIKDGRKVVVK